MSGQSLTDRFAAAQHSVTGSSVTKAVCKATTHEAMGPKKKHLDYLTACTNEVNVSIPQLADTLFERAVNNSWVVVFKALITSHHIMCYGNERFFQYLASRNTLFNLTNYVDKSGVQGYDMSTFIRRYSKYLNEKAYSYRVMAFDFTRIKRGAEGVLRMMNTEKLLKTLVVVQSQLDTLLDFEVTPNDLTNGVINSAFMLLFKDLIRLFACYNDGIINLLEKYFEMNKKQCKEALDLYKKFLTRMNRVSDFLKVAECVGIDKGDIPDLTQAPSSLLDALEQHLASLEGKKTKDAPMSASSRSTSLSTAVSALSSTGVSLTRVDEREKRAALDEEQARLEALKEQRLRELGKQGSPESSGTSPNSTPARSITSAIDLLAAPSPAAPTSEPQVGSDLFGLQPNFVPSITPAPLPNPWSDVFPSPFCDGNTDQLPFASSIRPSSSDVTFPTPPDSDSTAQLLESYPARVARPIYSVSLPPAGASFNPFLGFGSAFVAMPTGPGTGPVLQPDFDSVFGNKAAHSDKVNSAADILQPMVLNQTEVAPVLTSQPGQLAVSDIDTSLANLVGNLTMNSSLGKNLVARDHQWTPAGEKRLTGGANWQPRLGAPNSWGPSVPTAIQTQTNGWGLQQYVPPAAGVPLVQPQPAMFNQPVMQPNNPFGPVPGAQMQFM